MREADRQADPAQARRGHVSEAIQNYAEPGLGTACTRRLA